MTRYRVTFGKGEAVRYISHLDLMRTWERILRRAGMRLAHTQGFNPRPRLVFAAPLSVGVTSDAEIVDVMLDDDLSPLAFQERLRKAPAPGIDVRDVVKVGPDEPPVMACVSSADYAVTVEASGGGEAIEEQLRSFLANDSVPYERVRKASTKQADMRPAILDLWVESEPGAHEVSEPAVQLGMRLRLDQQGLGVRPEEVVAALEPTWRVRRVHRTRLRLKEVTGNQREALTLPSPAAAGEGFAVAAGEHLLATAREDSAARQSGSGNAA